MWVRERERERERGLLCCGVCDCFGVWFSLGVIVVQVLPWPKTRSTSNIHLIFVVLCFYEMFGFLVMPIEFPVVGFVNDPVINLEYCKYVKYIGEKGVMIYLFLLCFY
jgi:hypothetical protein